LKVPKNHHLDRRADELAAAGAGDPDELLDTEEVAAWLHVSMQWLEIARHHGYGPPFTKLSPRMIRYKRSDVLAWLNTRKHASTAEYRAGRKPKKKRAEARV
jgi:predicted DNA-binding transcriptional regulator AlpA